MVAGDVRPDTYSGHARLRSPTPRPTTPSAFPSRVGDRRMSAETNRRSASAQRRRQPVVAGMLETGLRPRGRPASRPGSSSRSSTRRCSTWASSRRRRPQRKARADVVVSGEQRRQARHGEQQARPTARAKLATAKSGLLKAEAALLKARTATARASGSSCSLPRRSARSSRRARRTQGAGVTVPAGPGAASAAEADRPAHRRCSPPSTPDSRASPQGSKTIDAEPREGRHGTRGAARASAQIASAASKLADAKTQLKNAKDVLEHRRRRARASACDIAEARRAQATVRSPVDGVVTFARHGGHRRDGGCAARAHP